jgi:hypothetical protein
MLDRTWAAAGPDIRITATPARPDAVAGAKMVLLSDVFEKVGISLGKAPWFC